MGGTVGAGTSSVLFMPVDSNNPLVQWSITTALPAARYSMPAVLNNGRVYVMGGLFSGNATSSVFFSSLASRNLFWGASVPGGQAGGNYSSTLTYTAVFSP
jgi:hypothetical protein